MSVARRDWATVGYSSRIGIIFLANYELYPASGNKQPSALMSPHPLKSGKAAETPSSR